MQSACSAMDIHSRCCKKSAPVPEVVQSRVFCNPDQPLQGRRSEQGCRPRVGAAAGQGSLQSAASLDQSRCVGARQQRRHNRLHKHGICCQHWRQLRVAAQVGRDAQQQLREPTACRPRERPVRCCIAFYASAISSHNRLDVVLLRAWHGGQHQS